MKRIGLSVAFGLLWVGIGYVSWDVSVRHRYLATFEATRPGDDMVVVLQRFGVPSHIDPHPTHAVGYAYSLRFWYERPFSMGTSPITVDFDSKQTVVGKYQWNSP
jgi:hypothetical protein